MYNMEVVTSELFGAFTKKSMEEKCETFKSKHIKAILNSYDDLLEIIEEEDEKKKKRLNKASPQKRI